MGAAQSTPEAAVNPPVASLSVTVGGKTPAINAVASDSAITMAVTRPTDLMVVRKFLLEVGLPVETVDNESWSELRGYLRCRLNI